MIKFKIKQYVFQSELYFLKRFFFFSGISNTNNQENITSKLNHKSELYQENKKLLKVAILGLPNAGKSTLVNKLIRRSICPTSSKVHTTMHKAEAIYTEGNTQIIFMDTPGLVMSKEIKTYKLLKTFSEDPKNAITDADVIGIIQDVTNVYTRYKLDDFILNYIKNKVEDKPLLMIFNKIDKLKKKKVLLDLTRMLTNNDNYPKFDDIFMISALSGDGVDDLRIYLLDIAKVKNWKYKEEFYTDQSTKTIIEQTVRAKLLNILPYEMPYKVKIIIDHLEFGDDNINTLLTLDCPKQRYVRTLLKMKSHKIKCLAFDVEKELRHAFRTTVIVRINVKCTSESSQLH
ncbi:GTPase Era, mitochondrial [Apis laboriosa]|uniref:GTPase Era, mitochondrial n=1 Tax=Apis laboriosa TaxID=183418 RepID=UPI001CC4DD47|nr:GTPase Era, mitochondrial [Apis laboriosa]